MGVVALRQLSLVRIANRKHVQLVKRDGKRLDLESPHEILMVWYSVKIEYCLFEDYSNLRVSIECRNDVCGV